MAKTTLRYALSTAISRKNEKKNRENEGCDHALGPGRGTLDFNSKHIEKCRISFFFFLKHKNRIFFFFFLNEQKKYRISSTVICQYFTNLSGDIAYRSINPSLRRSKSGLEMFYYGMMMMMCLFLSQHSCTLCFWRCFCWSVFDHNFDSHSCFLLHLYVVSIRV